MSQEDTQENVMLGDKPPPPQSAPSSSPDDKGGKEDFSFDALRDTRIESLHLALKKVRLSFKRKSKDLLDMLGIFVTLTSIIIIIIGYKLNIYYDEVLKIKIEFPKLNNTAILELTYISVLRLTTLGLLLSLTIFFIKMIKSYLILLEENQHKLAIINSMASLVESGNSENRDKIYNQLTDIIIKVNNNTVKDNEVDIHFISVLKEIAEKILEVFKKK